MTLESFISADVFITDLYGMNAVINKEVTSQQEECVWEEPY